MQYDKTFKVHMIGNAHIDPAWLWPWQDGFAEVKATFLSALDRLDQFPKFVFTCGGVLYYKWVEENEPEMFERIRRYVREKRWVIVGGWLLQPDCNTPSGESFARHALYGQRYFWEKFQTTCTTGYNVDSFGHNSMLPQLLCQSGMDNYVMMRPQAFELKLDTSLFWWQGPDGSRVLTYRIPDNYATYWEEENPVRQKAEKLIKLAEENRMDYMGFYGVGNHGGGPTILNIETILSLMGSENTPGKEKLCFGSPESYFSQVRAEGDAIETYTGELQHHASGCYSAHLRTKQQNRRAEERLANAEVFTVAAACWLGRKPLAIQAEMQAAWEKVLFNQFHDIMGGCSIRQVYQDSDEFYGYALTIGAEALNRAVQAAAWRIDTTQGRHFPLSRDKDWLTWEKEDMGVPLVVFNPLGWDVQLPVVVDKKLAGVADAGQKELPFQIVRSPRSDLKNIWDTVFMAKVPAMGYRVYWLYNTRETAALPEGAADAGGVCMENGLLKVVFEKHTGHIQSLYDKKAGRELLSGKGAVPLVMEERHSDTWGHSTNYYDQLLACFTDGTVEVLEQGPLRSKIRVINRYNESLLQQDFILYAEEAAVRVEAKVLWRERCKMLKLEFPVKADNPEAYYEIPYGWLPRPADGEEEPMQQWFAVQQSGEQGKPGLALLNNGLYSACAKGDKMRMTVLRSPVFAHNSGLYLEDAYSQDDRSDFMEQGEHLFTYQICPYETRHKNLHFAEITRRAREMNTSFPAIKETYHPGPLPLESRGIVICAENVAAPVLKIAEDGTGMILRLQETAGQDCRVEVNLAMAGRSFELEFHKLEIKTLRIPFEKNQPVQETDFLEGLTEQEP